MCYNSTVILDVFLQKNETWLLKNLLEEESLFV